MTAPAQTNASVRSLTLGGLVAWFLGVNAEGRSLEDVAEPLSSTNRLIPAYPAGPRSRSPIEERIRLN